MCALSEWKLGLVTLLEYSFKPGADAERVGVDGIVTDIDMGGPERREARGRGEGGNEADRPMGEGPRIKGKKEGERGGALYAREGGEGYERGQRLGGEGRRGTAFPRTGGDLECFAAWPGVCVCV